MSVSLILELLKFVCVGVSSPVEALYSGQDFALGRHAAARASLEDHAGAAIGGVVGGATGALTDKDDINLD